MNQEFQAFPKTHTQQIETRRKAEEPYVSPKLSPEALAVIEAQRQRKAQQGSRAAASGIQGTIQETYPQAPAMEYQAASAPVGIPIQSPGFTAPTSEPEAVILDLPSRYAFYDFKDLYVQPFRGRHLAKLSRASEEGSTLHMVEAVSSVLSNTQGDRNLGFRLTASDFYFVLYWLRLNSFTKTAFLHETTCSAQKHLDLIADNKLEPSTLRHKEIISKSSLRIDMLDKIPDPADYPLEYQGVYLKPSTMQDAIEFTEHPRFDDPEFRYAAQLAVNIHVPGAKTLDEHILVVDDMCAEDHHTIAAYESACASYGIVEQIRVICKHCGASKVDRVKVAASSFFPSPA